MSEGVTCTGQNPGEWSPVVPDETGWYEVKWMPEASPERIFVSCVASIVLWVESLRGEPELLGQAECDMDATLFRRVGV